MNEIQRIRKKTGLSQAGFADKYNLPVRTLQQWEQNLQNPPPYVLSMLKQIVEADYDDKNEANFEVNSSDFRVSNQSGETKYISHATGNPSSWKVCIERTFKNCEHIYPIQQRKVREVLDIAEANPSVKEVIIFGSSVSSKCHIGSDLDIYMEVDDDINPLSRFGFNPEWKYDLFTNYMVDDRLYKEIVAKGVKVYG